MTRKKSKYKPTPARRVPIVWRFDRETETKLQLLPHQTLEDLRHGRGDEPGWNALALRLNIGYVMAGELYEDEAALQCMQRALDALRAVEKRYEERKIWGTSAEEFFAMGDGLNLCDQMQRECTRREMDAAMNIVYAVAARR